MRTRTAINTLIVAGLSVIIILFLTFFQKNKLNQDKIVPIKLNRLVEIPHNDAYGLEKPGKMLCYQNKIYIYEHNSMKILVFNEDGFSHAIGDPEAGFQGIQYSASFDISNNKIFLLNHADTIEIFNIDGKYINTIQLKKDDFSSMPTDLKIDDRYIFVAFETGETRVQRYDLNGAFIDDFIKKGTAIKNQKYTISGSSSIYIIPGNHELILVNRFNGDIEIFNIHNGALLMKIANYDPQTVKRLDMIEEDIKAKRSGVLYSNEVKSIVMWRCAIDYSGGKLLLIPSQASVKEANRSSKLYSVDLKTKSIKKTYLQINSIDFVIRDCCFKDEQIIFLDYNLNLFCGG